MNPNVYIGTTGQTMYVGDKEVLAAFYGEHLIFPVYDLQVRYSGTGAIPIVSQTSGIEYVLINGTKYTDIPTTFEFPEGQPKEVWFRGTAEGMCSGLTSVVAVTAYTSTPTYGFTNCTNLTGLTIDDKGQVETIETFCFSGCTALTSQLIIPNSLKSIGPQAFAGSSISGPLNLNNVTGVSYQAFYQCTGLTSVMMSNDLTKLAVQAFQYCSNVTAVTISTGLTEIQTGVFEGCNIRTLRLPSTITSIKSGAFNGNLGEVWVNSPIVCEDNNCFGHIGVLVIFNTPYWDFCPRIIIHAGYCAVNQSCEQYYELWVNGMSYDPNHFECNA